MPFKPAAVLDERAITQDDQRIASYDRQHYIPSHRSTINVAAPAPGLK
jgi:hypothetical protein